jgi:septal ring factor EnvC (AmiA/AmiB activator)
MKHDAISQRKRSKVDSLVEEIMNKKRMINTIKTTLAQQEKELDKINKEIDDCSTYDDVSDA